VQADARACTAEAGQSLVLRACCRGGRAAV
jgi:hypothetical protein